MTYVKYVNDINDLVSYCAPLAGSGAASAPIHACKIMRFFYQGVSENPPEIFCGDTVRPTSMAAHDPGGGVPFGPFDPLPGCLTMPDTRLALYATATCPTYDGQWTIFTHVNVL